MKTRLRSWLLALVALCLLALGLLLTLEVSRKPSTSAKHERARHQAAVLPRPARRTATERTGFETPAEADPAMRRGPPPVIDKIQLEKKEVCQGEENLVTVSAHTVDGTDAFLHYTIGSQTGLSVPLRSYTDADQGPPRTVAVFGKNNVVTIAQIPRFVVKDCKVARQALLRYRLRPNTWGQFDFQVKVLDLAPKANAERFLPAAYHWRFGDGSTAVTTTPAVSHDYEQRSQDALYANYLVSVEVHDEQGRRLVGRRALQLLNPAFEAWAHKGLISLMVRLDPRYPRIDEDGVVRQGIRLWHTRPEAVTIKRVLKERPGAAATLVPASQVLGTSRIPPGPGIRFEVTLDTRKDPKLSLENYTVQGEGADGHPVLGAFSVMRPPPAPTREDSVPVTDPVLRAKILAARKLLGKALVTDEEIFRLEAEGAFSQLEVDPQDPAELERLKKRALAALPK